MAFSRDEIKKFLSKTKVIENLDWFVYGENSERESKTWRFESELAVMDTKNPSKITDYMEIRGRLCIYNDDTLSTNDFNLSLNLFHSSILIERADRNDPHQNVSRGHKHEIQEDGGDDVAWKPNDVNWSSMKSIITDVFKEWNIIYDGDIYLPDELDEYQTSLDDYNFIGEINE